MMVLVLAAFQAWWRAESAENSGRAAVATAVMGALCGLLFLAEYSAGSLIFVAAAGTALRFGGAGRWKSLGLLVGCFVLVCSPWVARNMAVTGLPVGLAYQNIALKAGDSTAEPAIFRATLSPKLPSLDLNKLSNKFLSTIQETIRTRAWSGGSMWFTAFFAAGWLYVFKSAPVNRLRWLFAISLVVLVGSQAAFNSGESERLAVVWLAPLVIVFGAGFFFVLVSSNALLGSWPRLCAGVLIALQALPLAHDALDPRWLHFQYPPYFPQLFQGMRRQMEVSDAAGRFGLMADVPAGLAWWTDPGLGATGCAQGFLCCPGRAAHGRTSAHTADPGPAVLFRPEREAQDPGLPYCFDTPDRRVGGGLRRAPDGFVSKGVSTLSAPKDHRGPVCAFQRFLVPGPLNGGLKGAQRIGLASS
jgi:hypothetical protein